MRQLGKDMTAEVKNLISTNNICFKMDCARLLDDGEGSYYTQFNNVEELLDKIGKTKWHLDDNVHLNNKNVRVARGNIDGYSGIFSKESTEDADRFLLEPSKYLSENIVAVIKAKGIKVNTTHIVFELDEEGNYKYITMGVGNYRKLSKIFLYDDTQLNMLFGKEIFERMNCMFAKRISPRIAGNLVVRAGIRNEQSYNGVILENFYLDNVNSSKSYNEFLDRLNSVKWKKTRGTGNNYTCKGVSGRAKYIPLNQLDPSKVLTVTKEFNDTAKLVSNDYLGDSNCLNMRIYTTKDSVSITDVYFGKNLNEPKIYTECNELTVADAIALGFTKVRILKYSKFEDYNREFIFDFINPWLENSREFLQRWTAKDFNKYIELFKEDTNSYYKGMSVYSEEPLNTEDEIKAFINTNLLDLGKLTSCTTDKSRAKIFAKTYSSAKGLNNVTFILKIAGDMSLIIGGMDKEVIIHNPVILDIVDVQYRG